MGCATILIVDDDPDIRRLCRLFLEPKYDVIEAEDGEAGWKMLLGKQPDLVLTDMVMPGVNGLDLATRIKSHPELHTTLVVMMTGATDGEELPDGFWKMGTPADVFVQKPLEMAKLRGTIDSLFEKRVRPRPSPRGGYM